MNLKYFEIDLPRLRRCSIVILVDLIRLFDYRSECIWWRCSWSIDTLNFAFIFTAIHQSTLVQIFLRTHCKYTKTKYWELKFSNNNKSAIILSSFSTMFVCKVKTKTKQKSFFFRFKKNHSILMIHSRKRLKINECNAIRYDNLNKPFTAFCACSSSNNAFAHAHFAFEWVHLLDQQFSAYI